MLGQTLNNRYTVTVLIGQGAMGKVYHATDTQTGQAVAVKVLGRDLAFESGMLERFRREGEALRQLRHPNIVGFVDMFEHESQQIIVMEYVSGGSLYDLLAQGRLPVDRTQQIALDLCDALIRAHRLSIIHRDIKPANVLLAEDGTPRLTDFGVAKLLSEGTRLTGTGTQVGTPYYMSPEAWEGQPLDAQADIWSLGVVLYEMLAGEVPFSGDTIIAVMNKVLNAPLPDLQQARPEVPAGLAQIVRRMLTRDLAARYPSMRRVAADLEAGVVLRSPDEVEPKSIDAAERKRQATEAAQRQYQAKLRCIEAEAHAEKKEWVEALAKFEEAQALDPADTAIRRRIDAVRLVQRQAQEAQQRAAKAEAERQRRLAAEAEKKRLAEEAQRAKAERQAAVEAEKQARLAAEAEKKRLAAEAQRAAAEKQTRLAAEAEKTQPAVEAQPAAVEPQAAAEAEKTQLMVEAQRPAAEQQAAVESELAERATLKKPVVPEVTAADQQTLKALPTVPSVPTVVSDKNRRRRFWLIGAAGLAVVGLLIVGLLILPGLIPPPEPVTIRWLLISPGADTDAAQRTAESVAADFNKSQNRIRLELKVVSNSGTLNTVDNSNFTKDTLSAEIASGNGLDIIGPVNWPQASAFHDQWLDLSPHIKAANYDLTQFPPSLVNMYQTDVGQEGLPFIVYPSALFYNTLLFYKAGLADPPARYGEPYQMPDGTQAEWNWDTVAHVARLLTIDSSGRNATQPGFDSHRIVQYGFTWQWERHPNYWGSFWGGGSMLAPGGSPGNYSAQSPEAWKDAWAWTHDGIWGVGPFMPSSQVEDSPDFGSGNSFGSGKTAMTDQPIWYTCCVNDLKTWDLAAMPGYNGQPGGRMDSDTFRIWKGTRHPQEAFTVYAYLIGDGVQKLLIGSPDMPPIYDGVIPARAANRQPWFDAKKAQFPWVTNWDILIGSLDYPDVPSAESYTPNWGEAWRRGTDFTDLLRGTEGLNLDSEIANYENDLTVIFNK